VVREAARGRLAHQMCRVEMCPCRMFFSRRDSSETSRMGKATSMSRRSIFPPRDCTRGSPRRIFFLLCGPPDEALRLS